MEACRRAHLSVKVEAGSNLTLDHSHSCPADILVPNWSVGKPAAFDLSVTSPLNLNILLKAGVTAGATELRKHEANDGKSRELGCFYGACDAEAMESLSHLASSSSNKARAAVLNSLYGRLNLNANATAMLSKCLASDM